MHTTRIRIMLGCSFLAVSVFVWAQTRKPGLWEITTTTTWQQSPMPAGTPAPPNSPFAGGPRTTQVCLTQEQIDKYGSPLPQMRGDCSVTNIVKKPTGMTADMACTGRMTGKGTVESTLIDGEHAKGKVHFTGSLQAGANPRPVEWTSESTSVFKGADCGDVKPLPVPDK
jgi:Protein of unknown function (DUF3617)